jgi:thiol-disulfide isomerase/thioredoxin
MLKKSLLIATALVVALVAFGFVMYITNPPPAVSPVSVADAASGGKPFVVKIHAQWCPVCMATKDEWSQIAELYSQRVNLVVWDFTNQANTDASQADAKRLGLDALFDEYAGATGTIVILNGRTKQVTASINGSREFREYRAAIDMALDATKSP